MHDKEKMGRTSMRTKRNADTRTDRRGTIDTRADRMGTKKIYIFFLNTLKVF